MSDDTKREPLFVLICKLAEKDGVASINRLDGCWERQIDQAWFMALNGHQKAVKCSKGAEVPPFNCYVEFNGWAAALFDPFNGVFAAGDAANEEAFAAAIEAVLTALLAS